MQALKDVKERSRKGKFRKRGSFAKHAESQEKLNARARVPRALETQRRRGLRLYETFRFYALGTSA